MMAEKVLLTETKVDTRVKKEEITTILEDVVYSKKLIPWCSLLCYEGDSKDFLDILSIAKSEMLAVMKYRRSLMNGRKKPITCIELVKLHTSGELGELHKSLEKLFLEVIVEEHLEFILNKIDNSENGLQNMYDRHIDNNSLRIMSIALVI